MPQVEQAAPVGKLNATRALGTCREANTTPFCTLYRVLQGLFIEPNDRL